MSRRKPQQIVKVRWNPPPSIMECLPAIIGELADRWEMQRAPAIEMAAFRSMAANWKVLTAPLPAQRLLEFLADMAARPAWQPTAEYVWRLADLASVMLRDGQIRLVCDWTACDAAWRDEQSDSSFSLPPSSLP